MIDVFNAVLPVFMLILLGYGLKTFAFIPKTGWDGLERLTYYLFLPALLFYSFAQHPASDGQILQTTTVVMILMFAAATLVSFFVGRQILGLANKTFASFFQGSIRFNNYIGLSLATALFGKDGVTAYGIMILVAIPLANFLTLAVMAHYAHEDAFSLKRVLYRTAFNPLVLATVAGFVVSLMPLSFPLGASILKTLSAAALPGGVLGIGAALSMGHVKHAWPAVAGSCVIKLLVFPAFAMALLSFYDAPAPWGQVLLIFAATPCATSCYILSKQMNANAEAMASISAVMTLASAITLTFWIYGATV